MRSPSKPHEPGVITTRNTLEPSVQTRNQYGNSKPSVPIEDKAPSASSPAIFPSLNNTVQEAIIVVADSDSDSDDDDDGDTKVSQNFCQGCFHNNNYHEFLPCQDKAPDGSPCPSTLYYCTKCASYCALCGNIHQGDPPDLHACCRTDPSPYLPKEKRK